MITDNTDGWGPMTPQHTGWGVPGPSFQWTEQRPERSLALDSASSLEGPAGPCRGCSHPQLLPGFGDVVQRCFSKRRTLSPRAKIQSTQQSIRRRHQPVGIRLWAGEGAAGCGSPPRAQTPCASGWNAGWSQGPGLGCRGRGSGRECWGCDYGPTDKQVF